MVVLAAKGSSASYSCQDRPFADLNKRLFQEITLLHARNVLLLHMVYVFGPSHWSEFELSICLCPKSKKTAKTHGFDFERVKQKEKQG